MTTPAELDRHLVVVGMMGSGKTTLGKALAAELGVDYLDNDATIEVAEHRSGRAIAAAQGVDELHEIEAQTLLDQLDHVPSAVISAAASVVDSPACRAALARRAVVCWIDVDLAQLERRLGRGAHRRSMDVAELRRLYVDRRPRFASVADVHVRRSDPLQARVDAVVRYLRGSG